MKRRKKTVCTICMLLLVLICFSCGSKKEWECSATIISKNDVSTDTIHWRQVCRAQKGLKAVISESNGYSWFMIEQTDVCRDAKYIIFYNNGAMEVQNFQCIPKN